MSQRKQTILKTQIIVNPESDKGRTRKRWKHIKEALKTFLKDYKCEFTEKPFQATEISRTAIKDGSELIVGVGGDGTMNEIANGFFENKKIINPETALGIVPSGSGSDLSRSLKIPSKFFDAMKVITQTSSKKIDLGKVSYRAHDHIIRERYFLNISDFGIGGEVVRRVDQDRKKNIKSAYLKSLISSFLLYKGKNLRVTVDGKDLPVDKYMIGAISNGSIFGKGMKIAPEAKLDDGYFDVILIKNMKTLEFFWNVKKLYSGTHLSHPKVLSLRGKRVEVEPVNNKEEILIEADGEQLGMAPASFEILPGRFLVKC